MPLLTSNMAVMTGIEKPQPTSSALASSHLAAEALDPFVKRNNQEKNYKPELRHRELLYSDIGLSFWGGVDPVTARVVDHTHPLYGQIITDKILVIPSGRGSCTGSQVMLELILNGVAPRAIITRNAIDVILAVGIIVAREVFREELKRRGVSPPAMVSLGDEDFNSLNDSCYAVVEGLNVFHGHNEDDVLSAMATTGDPVKWENNRLETLSTSAERRGDNNITSTYHNLELTDQECAILSGEHSSATEAERIAMRTVAEVAILSGAKRLLPVKRAHIDGVTYIGPGGLRFVRELVRKGGQVAVPTTLNSSSADRRRWKNLGVPPDLGEAACGVGDAYLALGCDGDSFTCAPYLLSNRDNTKRTVGPPVMGDQVAWGESNAVVYANSILGARTEKYADYLDVCAALVGRVPEAGVHVDENRRPGVFLDAEDIVRACVLPSRGHHDGHSDGANPYDLDEIDAFYPVLGYICGNLSDGKVPLIFGLEEATPTLDDLKAFSAAFGTTGTVPLFHMAGVTPEAEDVTSVEDACFLWRVDARTIGTVQVTTDHVKKAFRALDSGSNNGMEVRKDDVGTKATSTERIDLIALGNPHLSLTECQRLVRLCNTATPTEKKHPNVSIVATLGRAVYAEATSLGYISTLNQFGISFINDTCWCMLTEPVIPTEKETTIMTNSGKYAHYAPGLVNRRTRFAGLAGCFEAARTGRFPSSRPQWMMRMREFSSFPFSSFWAAHLRLGHQQNYFGGFVSSSTTKFMMSPSSTLLSRNVTAQRNILRTLLRR